MGVAERREREKQERREAILAAASSVFLERGVGGATMEDIAREAELSKGALYLYFSSKDELFLAIALSALQQLAQRLAQVEHRVQADGGDGRAVCAELLRCYVQFAAENRSRFRIAMSWLSSSHQVGTDSSSFPDYQRAIQRVLHCAVRALTRGRDEGSLQFEGSAERVAMQMWGAAVGLALVEQNAQEVQRRLGASVPMEGLAEDFTQRLVASFAPGISPPRCGDSFSTSTENEK